MQKAKIKRIPYLDMVGQMNIDRIRAEKEKQRKEFEAMFKPYEERDRCKNYNKGYCQGYRTWHDSETGKWTIFDSAGFIVASADDNELQKTINELEDRAS